MKGIVTLHISRASFGYEVIGNKVCTYLPAKLDTGTDWYLPPPIGFPMICSDSQLVAQIKGIQLSPHARKLVRFHQSSRAMAVQIPLICQISQRFGGGPNRYPSNFSHIPDRAANECRVSEQRKNEFKASLLKGLANESGCF